MFAGAAFANQEIAEESEDSHVGSKHHILQRRSNVNVGYWDNLNLNDIRILRNLEIHNSHGFLDVWIEEQSVYFSPTTCSGEFTSCKLADVLQFKVWTVVSSVASCVNNSTPNL